MYPVLFFLAGEPYGFLSVLSPVIQLDNVAMAEIWLVMILESALMCVLIWYLGNVLSWAIGVPLVPWFPFTARYWFPGRQGTFTQFPPKIPDGVHFEAYPKDLEAAVFVNRRVCHRTNRIQILCCALFRHLRIIVFVLSLLRKETCNE